MLKHTVGSQRSVSLKLPGRPGRQTTCGVVIQPVMSLWSPLDPLHNNICLDRFVPRHDDELELEVDDPLLVEVQSEDYWYEGYNMRTGARGIFPAYYAIEVTKDPESYKGTRAELIFMIFRNYIIESPFKQAVPQASAKQCTVLSQWVSFIGLSKKLKIFFYLYILKYMNK